jgi:hypothetical protein
MTAQEALKKATRNSGSFGLLMRAIEKSCENEQLALYIPFGLDKHVVVQLKRLGYAVTEKEGANSKTTEISWVNPKDIIKEVNPTTK